MTRSAVLLIALVAAFSGCASHPSAARYEGRTVEEWLVPMAKEADPVTHGRRRAEAANAIDAMGADAIPGLIRALKHESPIIREQAAFGLGRLAAYARPAVPALIETLCDKNFLVIESADGALESIAAADPESIPDIRKALDDKRPNVRAAVRELLGE